MKVENKVAGCVSNVSEVIQRNRTKATQHYYLSIVVMDMMMMMMIVSEWLSVSAGRVFGYLAMQKK